MLLSEFTTAAYSPLTATDWGLLRPLPVRVASTDPLRLTTETELLPLLTTQGLTPSKRMSRRPRPTETDRLMAPAESSLWTLDSLPSVTQMLDASNSIANGEKNPVLKVEVVQGSEAAGVRMEPRPGLLADRSRARPNVSCWAPLPRAVETPVTAPAGWLGSIE